MNLLDGAGSVFNSLVSTVVDEVTNYFSEASTTELVGAFLIGAGAVVWGGYLGQQVERSLNHRNIVALQSDRDRYQAMMNNADRINRNLSGEVSSLENKLENAKLQSEREKSRNSSLIQQLDSEKIALESELKKVRVECDEWKVKVGKVKSTVTTLIEPGNEKETSVKEAGTLDGQKRRLIQQNKTLGAKNRNLTQNLEETLKEKSLLQAQVNELTAKIGKAESTIGDLRSQIEKNKEETEECKSAFDQLLKAGLESRDLEKSLLARISFLESKNRDLCEELQEGLDEINELQSFLVKAEATLKAKNGELDKLESLLELANAQIIQTLDDIEPNPDFSKDEIARLEQELRDVTDKSSRLIRQYEQELAMLMQKRSLEKADGKARLLGGQSSVYLENDGASLQELQKKYNELEIINSENATIALRSEAEVIDLKKAIPQLDAVVREKDSEIERLQKEMDAKVEESNTLAKVIDDQKSTIARLEKKVVALEETLQGKNVELEEFLSSSEQSRTDDLLSAEQDILSELYKGLSLQEPKKLNLETAVRDIKHQVETLRNSIKQDAQQLVAAYARIAELEEAISGSDSAISQPL